MMKFADKVRAQYVEKIFQFMESLGEDVGMIESNSFNFPVVLDGEEGLRGVSFCAVCDGAFYQGRDVAVCGGGNTALQDARFLSELCRSVGYRRFYRASRSYRFLYHEQKSVPFVSLFTLFVIVLHRHRGKKSAFR